MADVQLDICVEDISVEIEGVRIACRRFRPAGTDSGVGKPTSWPAVGKPTVVMLHEGLGSITQWRELPATLARRCGLEVVAYDRGGYGRSAPQPTAYGEGFMEREATDVLPAVLSGLGIEEAILVGHSDGASIALIAAGLGSVAPLGVAAIAPHTFIEDICIEGIRRIDVTRDEVIAGLARHHDNPRLAFERWRDVWLTPQFRDWDIRPLLARITCEVLVLQGDADQYGTDAQVTTITEQAPRAKGRILAECGHVAHRDQPAEIADSLAEFIDRAAGRSRDA